MTHEQAAVCSRPPCGSRRSLYRLALQYVSESARDGERAEAACQLSALVRKRAGNPPARRQPRGCHPSGRGLPLSTAARGRKLCSPSCCTAESKAEGDSKAFMLGGVLGASASTPSSGSTTRGARLSAADIASARRRQLQLQNTEASMCSARGPGYAAANHPRGHRTGAVSVCVYRQ